MQHRGAVFYIDDGMVAFTDPDWLQGTFNTLTGLLNIAGLLTNNRKMVRMIFCPCHEEEIQWETVYERRVTGEGLNTRRDRGSECSVRGVVRKLQRG